MENLTQPPAQKLSTNHDHGRDIPALVGESLTFGAVADVLLACHGRAPLRDDEWQRFLERIAKPGYKVILVSTLGAEPDSEQRHQFHTRLATSARGLPRIAVLTTSPTMRWAHIARRLVASIDAMTFSYDALPDATRFLGRRAAAERLLVARNRAHYLLEKRVAQQQPLPARREPLSARREPLHA
jgi:hypothetical protein